MKHLIFLLGIILAFAFSLAGCRSHSVVTKTDSKVDSLVVHNVQQQTAVQRTDSVHAIASTQFEEATHIKLIQLDYDTSMPNDSLTGKPPIKRATYVEFEKKANNITAVESTQKTNNTQVSNTQDSTNIVVKKVASADSKSVTTSFPWRVLLISIICIALLAAGIEIKRRFF